MPRGAPASRVAGTLALAGQSSGPSQDSQDAQLDTWGASPTCSPRASRARGQLQIIHAEDGGQSGPSARLFGSLGQVIRPHGNAAAQSRENTQVSGDDRPNQLLEPGLEIGRRAGFAGNAGPISLLRPRAVPGDSTFGQDLPQRGRVMAGHERLSPSNVSQVYHEVIENQHRSNQQTLRGFERVVKENEALKRRMSEMEAETAALREQIAQM